MNNSFVEMGLDGIKFIIIWECIKLTIPLATLFTGVKLK